MKKMIARTALVASFALAAVSLSACGSTADCANAAGGGDTVTVTSAMFPASGGGHGSGHSSSHDTSHDTSHETSTNGTSRGSTGFWPHWFGGSHSECTSNSAPTKNS